MTKLKISRTESVSSGTYNENGTLQEALRGRLLLQVIEAINEGCAAREAKKGDLEDKASSTTARH